MKKEFIQNKLRDKIAAELNNGTPMAELKALASEIIEVCQRYAGDSVPNTALLEVLHRHPDLTSELKDIIKTEYKDATDETLEMIRQGLKGKMS